MRKLALWGNGLAEYQEMFALSELDSKARWLEYGCGASAVNSERHAKGLATVSMDALFTLNKPTLATTVSFLFDEMIEDIHITQDNFDFSTCGGLEPFIDHHRQGIATFLADYEKGREEERYLPLSESALAFADFSFDLALSVHYLFADLDEQDVEFHLQVIRELARVAKEVRIFPLIDRHGQASPLLGPVLLGLQQDGYGVEVREVDYALKPTSNAMLRVWAQQCQLD